MKKTLLLSVFTLIYFANTIIANPIKYSQYFTEKTMRVDYFHTGTSVEEHFSVDRILNDGDWAGSKSELIDDLNRGLYMYKVLDAVSGVEIYSRGFASIFGEWQTIPEAKTQWGTFHESVRFPWPKKSS